MRFHTPRFFLTCQKGITAVEFAFIAPVLALMMCGIVEFSIIAFVSSVLEGATTVTARVGKTGYIAAGNTRQQQIVNSVNDKTQGLLDPAKITVSTKVYAGFEKVGQPEPCISPVNPPCAGTPGVNFVDINGNGQWDSDMGSAGLGNPGDVVVYTVNYPWSVMTPIISNIIGTTLNLSARAVIRNEPYDTTTR